MSYAEKKQLACELRHAGWSVGEIATTVKVAKSTAWLWVRHIERTPKQEQVFSDKQRAARARNIKAASQHRTATLCAAKATYVSSGFAQAQGDEVLRLIAMMYWCEGNKTPSCTFRVTNSDPKMLSLVVRWIRQVGLHDKIRFCVTYYENHGFTEQEIRDWWLSAVPDLEERHFLAGRVKNTTNVKTKKANRLPYGTGAVTVHSTELWCRVKGAIDYLQSEQFANSVSAEGSSR